METCCHNTQECTGTGENHLCETSTDIRVRKERVINVAYTAGLRQAVEDAKATADHRALVIADLNIKLQHTKNQEERLELVFICARDIVNAWPQTTIRTLGEMTKRMDTLRQALEAAGK